MGYLYGSSSGYIGLTSIPTVFIISDINGGHSRELIHHCLASLKRGIVKTVRVQCCVCDTLSL